MGTNGPRMLSGAWSPQTGVNSTLQIDHTRLPEQQAYQNSKLETGSNSGNSGMLASNIGLCDVTSPIRW